MNEPDDDLSSRSHYAFLATMLPRDFGVQIDQCRFIVGDNCSVNRLLAMLMGYLLLGADGQVEDAHSIRQVSDTRWSSTFGMLKRYFQLLEFLDAEDDDIMEVLPSPTSNKRLRALFKELKSVESVAKALQGRDVDLLDVRQCPDFESVCVRVLRGRQNRLTRAEKTALGPFVKLAGDATVESDNEDLSFVERHRKRRRIAGRAVS
ncbi:hypothetical protein PPTG_20312 [Phytophthora nicotianae INRA-310]|uniref:Uncharacterized protein n=1 Tax=Phytophthora nicotianae (strain INRA-310) TaxID=761204 RepID=W2P993_PHYN3|nr:hypothetical protein PPTG_20312 [Phytophthora nicotianae INRA-310]ETM97391.1 hypothetical protein PPTG_20312 [Phytophthora nicotianae INRA-310]